MTPTMPPWVRVGVIVMLAAVTAAFFLPPAVGQGFRGGPPRGGPGGGINGGGAMGRGGAGGVNGGAGGVNGGAFNGGGVNGGAFNGGGPGGPVEKIWICDSCKREVGRGEHPPNLTKCPYCGVRISYIRDTDGSTRPIDSSNSGTGPFSGSSSKGDPATVRWVVLGIVAAVVVVALIVGGIVLLVVLTGGSKKKPKRRRRFDPDYDYGY